MGLFSSTYQTRVATVVSRVFEDKLLPNSIRTGGLIATTFNLDITETALDALENSIALKAGQMYTYGKQHYTHGLPSGQFSSAIQGRAEVTAVLNALYGGDVDLDYSHYQPPNMQHVGWMKLTQDHGYNPTTNELANLSAVKGRAVYLEDMTLVIPEAQFATYSLPALEQWGDPATAGYAPSRKNATAMGQFRAHTPITRDASATVPYIRVDYSWEVPTTGPEPVMFTGTFNLTATGYDTQADYFQVKYTDGVATKYWMYKGGSGTHPTLDGVFLKPAEVNGTFFPFAYFRYNKVSGTADKNSDAYKTSKKLVKYLGMNYDQVSGAIDGNPNIADVEQAMLVMAVPANSTHTLELRYLYKFFDNLYAANTHKYSSPAALAIAQTQANGNDVSRSTLVIQDKRFKMALTNFGVTKKRVAGLIGKVGTHSFLLDETAVTRSYLNGVTLETFYEQVPVKVHVYRKQVSSAIYEEIRVVSLQMLYYIYEGYIATGDGNGAILLIPIDRSITASYSLPDREKLYARSMHYVFNSRVVTEIAWYQSEFFQFLVLAVAVAIFVVSLGSGFEALALALSTGTGVVAAALPLLLDLLINLGIGQLLKLVVKAVGIEASILIAVIAAVTTGYLEFSGTSLAGAPWAEQLLSLASGLGKAASNELSDMFKDLAKDFDALAALSDAANKELATANKLLERHNYLDPIVIFGETPNDFYNRTIHSGNVGIKSISAISSYVDIALTLPKLAETLGESPYELAN